MRVAMKGTISQWCGFLPFSLVIFFFLHYQDLDSERDTYQKELTCLLTELASITTTLLHDPDTGNLLPTLPRPPTASQVLSPQAPPKLASTPPAPAAAPTPTTPPKPIAKRIAALSRADSGDISPRSSTSFLALDLSTEDLSPKEAEVYEVRDTTSGDTEGDGCEQKDTIEVRQGDEVPPMVERSGGPVRQQRALMKQISDNLGGSVVIRYEESDGEESCRILLLPLIGRWY